MSGKPTGGSIRWNVVFLALEGCLICWAHFIVGVSWATLGVGFGGVLAFGIADHLRGEGEHPKEDPSAPGAVAVLPGSGERAASPHPGGRVPS